MSLFLMLFTISSIKAQDSIPTNIDISEKNNIEFQNYFFKALSQKAIFNYKTAIEYLNNCNQITPNNKSVLFELSKNYLKLGNNMQALEYIDLALYKTPNNIWMLEHKVTILKRLADFNEAIKVQEKIAKKYPNKKSPLVFLHLQNNNINEAQKILLELKEAKLLNSRLREIEKRLNNKKSSIITHVQKTKIEASNTDLLAIYEKEKNFKNLKNLLIALSNKTNSNNNDNDLIKYSTQGLTLFPAQPFIYLVNGKALNNKKKYKKALHSLQNGIDFVIDNTEIEAKFYLEMTKAYKGLNNIAKANIFKNKAIKILK
ncbi:tetratricopeptide repeat protein [Tenacibaculum aestuariivivum]|uniref:tetratricopeptide repeat protein n=1 Tax=Tenacibaculum aestuariivivum TaxID=2006131 RepID=UPI003AB5ED4B